MAYRGFQTCEQQERKERTSEIYNCFFRVTGADSGSDAEVITYFAICTHGTSLIPDPPPHVRVQGFGFARQSSNRKCFIFSPITLVFSLLFRSVGYGKPSLSCKLINYLHYITLKFFFFSLGTVIFYFYNEFMHKSKGYNSSMC